MRKLLRKYLAITKSASGDIVIEDNQPLKESVNNRNLGKYLFDTYGVTNIMFAEPGYMQYKFIFDCKTEEFKLVRYPKGTKQFSLTKSEKQKRMYDIVMDKALGENGWVFKNMFLKFDISKVESLKEKAPELKVVTEIKEDTENSKQLSEAPKDSESFSYGNNLMVGDSQIQGNIGKELQAKFGGVVVAKSGTRASQWVSNAESEDGSLGKELRKNPKNIFVLFGGNGTSGITDLLNAINKVTPNSKIHFISLPSPAVPTNGKVTRHEKVFPAHGKPYNYSDLHKARLANFTDSQDQVKASIPSSLGMVDFIDIFSQQWECESNCDGIHVTKEAAKKIVANISIKEGPSVNEEPLVG